MEVLSSTEPILSADVPQARESNVGFKEVDFGDNQQSPVAKFSDYPIQETLEMLAITGTGVE